MPSEFIFYIFLVSFSISIFPLPVNSDVKYSLLLLKDVMLLISARCRRAIQNKTKTFPKARSPLAAEFNNTRSICVCSTPPTENEMLIFSDNKYLQYYLGQVISNPNPKVNKGRNHFVNLNFVISSDLLLLYFWGLRGQAVQDWLRRDGRKMQRNDQEEIESEKLWN